MPHEIHVSLHASKRFAQRVDAVTNPVHAILRMWHTGSAPTQDELDVFRVTPRPGYEYRMGRHGRMRAVMAMAEEARCIVTIIYL